MLSEKNREAVKSSLLAGVAEACFAGAVVYLAGESLTIVTLSIVGGFLVGVTVGLLTTWYNEE